METLEKKIEKVYNILLSPEGLIVSFFNEKNEEETWENKEFFCWNFSIVGEKGGITFKIWD